MILFYLGAPIGAFKFSRIELDYWRADRRVNNQQDLIGVFFAAAMNPVGTLFVNICLCCCNEPYRNPTC